MGSCKLNLTALLIIRNNLKRDLLDGYLRFLLQSRIVVQIDLRCLLDHQQRLVVWATIVATILFDIDCPDHIAFQCVLAHPKLLNELVFNLVFTFELKRTELSVVDYLSVGELRFLALHLEVLDNYPEGL